MSPDGVIKNYEISKKVKVAKVEASQTQKVAKKKKIYVNLFFCNDLNKKTYGKPQLHSSIQ